MARIVSLHYVPKKIILDRGSRFTPRFWKSFHENMDAKLNFSSTYHPQADGQTKRTNQVLEDMLRACALQHGSSWDKSCNALNLGVEFFLLFSHQIQALPFSFLVLSLNLDLFQSFSGDRLGIPV
jgi:hypothetical protein